MFLAICRVLGADDMNVRLLHAEVMEEGLVEDVNHSMADMLLADQPFVAFSCNHGRERQSRLVWASPGIDDHHTLGRVLLTEIRFFYTDDLKSRVSSEGTCEQHQHVVYSLPALCCRLQYITGRLYRAGLVRATSTDDVQYAIMSMLLAIR